MTTFARHFGLLAFIVVALGGCDEQLTTPTAPQLMTESFGGTVTQGAAIAHPFTVHQQGGVQLTLTTLARENVPEGEEPGTPPPIGLGVGTWDGANCSRLAVKNSASPGTLISGTALAGEFCVAVYDSGSITEPLVYSVQVVHP